MRPLLLGALLLGACAHPAPAGPTLGRASQPYHALPEYLARPVAEHGLPPQQKDAHMTELLRVIDSQASALDAESCVPEAQAALQASVAQLDEVVPPKAALLVPIDNMRQVIDEMPRNSPEATRRRLWALTDLIRLRVDF